MIEFVARRLWYFLLWFMRRPVMRRAQRRMLSFLPEGRRDKALKNIHRQNDFARRIGLNLMRTMVSILFLSFGLSATVMIVSEMAARGALTVPR